MAQLTSVRQRDQQHGDTQTQQETRRKGRARSWRNLAVEHVAPEAVQEGRGGGRVGGRGGRHPGAAWRRGTPAWPLGACALGPPPTPESPPCPPGPPGASACPPAPPRPPVPSASGPKAHVRIERLCSSYYCSIQIVSQLDSLVVTQRDSVVVTQRGSLGCSVLLHRASAD